ncbi:MAG TPA: hypothetical protein P5149_14890 [Candidatus Competibacteraceae bacterium]|nr:hypothetical protein [Candidatus Competibacteraceae bacterium]MCP5135049.1 hypothetical protein [Gammaproteobacteria bacterium]HPF60052.1 hypothetical protein [Candidatus Competibacteraceae bacterium]HRY19674.1 hypothetical protein [Candidatus Competibacteraceae bacterium]
MTPMTRVAFSATALAVMTSLSSETALAACNATVNGRPMSPQECVLALQVYSQVVPGNYRVDNQGNWVNINNPWHRGNTYRDAQRPRGGAWGGQSLVSPRGIYDPTGGCEGGSCVNIID